MPPKSDYNICMILIIFAYVPIYENEYNVIIYMLCHETPKNNLYLYVFTIIRNSTLQPINSLLTN